MRFESAGQGRAGEPLIAPFRPAPTGAPALVQLRAADGSGGYTVVALGGGGASGGVALEQVRSLAEGDRLPAALELAAAVARHLPRSAARVEVLGLAGRLAGDAAPTLTSADLPRFDRAARLLGTPLFEDDGGTIRYRAAFEQRIEGKGAVAEEAAVQVIRRATPCTPAGVADRVEAFVARFPGSRRLPELRLWRARALEAALFEAGWKDAALHRQTVAAWERLARGAAAAEAREALARLKGRSPPRDAPTSVCPDPGAQ